MRIKLLILYPFDPFGEKVGGAETYIKGLIRHAPDDFEIELVGISSRSARSIKSGRQEADFGKRKFIFYPVLHSIAENKREIMPLALRYTIALSNAHMDLSGKVLLFNRIEPAVLFKSCNSPKIGIIHTDIKRHINIGRSEVLWGRMPILYRLVEKYIFDFMDRVFVINQETLNMYRSTYPNMTEKFIPITTWADSDIFKIRNLPREEIRKELVRNNPDLPQGGRWILFTGRLQEAKAPFRAVDAFADYNKGDRSSILIIIGEGNLRAGVEKHIRKSGLECKIFLLGRMDYESMADFYRAADVFLLTSNFEAMPMSVIESLACGTPVVSTDVGEVRKAVINGYSGEVVDNFSPATLSRAISNVLANPDIFSRKNCADSVKKYTPAISLSPVYAEIRKLYLERFK